MANLFYLPCELANGKQRYFHTVCPMWCDDHLLTEIWSIDFDDFDRSGPGLDEVAETAEILDSRGRPWGFRGARDATHKVGDYLPGDPLFISANENSIGQPLILEPVDGYSPRFNRQYPWSMMLSASPDTGSVVFTSTAGSPNTEAHDCSQTTRMTISTGALLEADFRFAMSGLCNGGTEQDLSDPWIRWTDTQNACVAHFLSVDPCEHAFSKIARKIVDNSPLNDGEIFWYDGTRFGHTPFELRFDLSCDDWWKHDPLNPDDRGRYIRDTWDQEVIDGVISPPKLLGEYNMHQQMQFAFVGASTGIWLKEFRMWDRQMTPADLHLYAPLAPP